MTAPQSREPARPRRAAQNAGSRHHPRTVAVFMGAWLIVTTAAGSAAALGAAKGQDPVVYLVLFAGWLFATPFLMPGRRRRKEDR